MNAILEDVIQNSHDEGLPKEWLINNIQSILITTLQSLPEDEEGLHDLLRLSNSEVVSFIKKEYRTFKNEKKEISL